MRKLKSLRFELKPKTINDLRIHQKGKKKEDELEKYSGDDVCIDDGNAFGFEEIRDGALP